MGEVDRAQVPKCGQAPWVVRREGGARLTALMTALNPGRRWEQARTLQLACQSLEQEVGVLIRLDLGRSDPRPHRTPEDRTDSQDVRRASWRARTATTPAC
jgi:hypothetical protein